MSYANRNYDYEMIRSELTWAVGEDYVRTDDSDKLGHSIDYYWVPELWHDRGQVLSRSNSFARGRCGYCGSGVAVAGSVSWAAWSSYGSYPYHFGTIGRQPVYCCLCYAWVAEMSTARGEQGDRNGV